MFCRAAEESAGGHISVVSIDIGASVLPRAGKHPTMSTTPQTAYGQGPIAQTGTGLNYSGKYIRYIKIPEIKPQGVLPESSTKRAVRAPNKVVP